jgi:hypothetical protein
LDGELINGSSLRDPATFIRLDEGDCLWALHEGKGELRQYRLEES